MSIVFHHILLNVTYLFLTLWFGEKNKELLNFWTFDILLGNSLVSSRLDYCNSLFYRLSANSLIRLQQVRNSLARVIMPSCGKFDHVGPVLSGLPWLPVEKRITFKLSTLAFTTWKTDQPRYLSELLLWFVPPRSLRSSGKTFLILPDIRSDNSRRSFSYAAPAVCIEFSAGNIRGSETVEGFRKLLKTYLFLLSSPLILTGSIGNILDPYTIFRDESWHHLLSCFDSQLLWKRHRCILLKGRNWRKSFVLYCI